MTNGHQTKHNVSLSILQNSKHKYQPDSVRESMTEAYASHETNIANSKPKASDENGGWISHRTTLFQEILAQHEHSSRRTIMSEILNGREQPATYCLNV